MNDKDFIYVGGVPGSGKTTLCKMLGNSLKRLNYISSGEIKGPKARRKYGISLRQLNQEQSLEINKWFFERLFSSNKKGIYLVDTHYTYPLPDFSFVTLCPESIASKIDLYILLETNASDIVNRRIFRGRARDSINKDFAELELKTEKNEAVRLSHKFGKPLVILKNEGDLNSSFLKFKNFLI